MMDSNGNGKIDQEEIDRIPSFVRDMMKSRGVELKPGMSLDDMRNGFRSGSGGNEQPGQQGNNQGSNPMAKKVLTPYKMKARKVEPLTLPPAYEEIDTDFDGQIGMHEWMMTRRTDLDQFDSMDTDYDGYLTPEELKAAETVAAVASTERKKLTIVSATPTKVKASQNATQQNSSPAGNNPWGGGGNPWGGSSGGGEVAMAPSYFERLDLNRDGMIDSDEWQQSRRVRGMFEQAGIPLDKMNLAQFTQNLAKVSSPTTGR